MDKTLFILMFVVFSIFAVTTISSQYAMTDIKDLPDINTLTYKYIWSASHYYVYDKDGKRYKITQQEYTNIPIPEKLGDGLYKMPDGKYLGQCQ